MHLHRMRAFDTCSCEMETEEDEIGVFCDNRIPRSDFVTVITKARILLHTLLPLNWGSSLNFPRKDPRKI